MWSLFRKKARRQEEEPPSIWKSDFTDCTALDYLPHYSVCMCENHRHCRHAAVYASVTLCSHPQHKSFIPKDSKPFDPRHPPRRG